jgi:hypothetical protein
MAGEAAPGYIGWKRYGNYPQERAQRATWSTVFPVDPSWLSAPLTAKDRRLFTDIDAAGH